MISQEQAINVAYTNVNLPYHMDLVYMESAPGLQYLLCRRNDKSVVGGTSILVDTFAVAEELKERACTTFIHTNILWVTNQNLSKSFQAKAPGSIQDA